MSECYGCQIKVNKTKDDVARCRTLVSGKKLTGVSVTGTVRIYNATSRLIELEAAAINNGTDLRHTIISNLDDPDNPNNQRIAVKGVSFDDLTLADWEAANRPWWFDYSAFKFAGNLWEVYDNSNLRVASGDYLKLSSCSLRYVVPEKICRKLYMQSAYLSVSGSNLFTICSKKLKGQDPSQSGSSSLINISVRPTYTLQLNVTF